MTATPTSDACAMKLQRSAGLGSLLSVDAVHPQLHQLRSSAANSPSSPPPSLSLSLHTFDTLPRLPSEPAPGQITQVEFNIEAESRVKVHAYLGETSLSPVIFCLNSVVFSSTLDRTLSARPSTRSLGPKSTDAPPSGEEVRFVPHNSLISTDEGVG